MGLRGGTVVVHRDFQKFVLRLKKYNPAPTHTPKDGEGALFFRSGEGTMRTSLSPHLQELLSQDVDPEDDAHYAQLRVGAGASSVLRLRPRGLELQLHPRLRRVGLGGDQVGPAGLEDHAGPVAVPAQGGRLGLDHPRDGTGCTKKKRMGLMASRCAS